MLIVLMLLIISLFRMNSLKVANNITLLDKNKELEIANKKAVESSKIKSQFVSTISHELRTPLYGVIGITNLLTDEHPELTNSKHLKSLEFSANYLLSLVNDILHINKIEENKSTIEKQNFDIYQEINLIRDSLFFIAKTNNNQFEINIDNDLPNNLLGDKVRLDQILMNLISNALKFTKNGIVKININLNKIVNNYYYLDFEVADNGVGIAKEDQIKVFEKFVQVGQNNDDYQGTGLGLAIVKNLINLFDSKLFLESELGKGTSFKFTIKLEKSLENNKILIVDDNKFNNLNINVLVVDDNKINQAVTKKILESKNSRCTILYDGFEAATLLQTNQFDIILMDINMPKINGYDTTKMIRQNGITTPIIALTAYSKDEISDKVFESGMNDILIKPFQPNKLFEIILKNLDKKNAG